jgi:hypothetical protein
MQSLVQLYNILPFFCQWGVLAISFLSVSSLFLPFLFILHFPSIFFNRNQQHLMKSFVNLLKVRECGGFLFCNQTSVTVA